MDMRIYYRKVHEIEQNLPEWNIVMSLETPDGGKPDVPAEVSRRNAAKLVVEGRARLASADEAREFQQARLDAKRAADEAAAASRIQVTLVPSAELQNLQSGNRPPKA